MFVVANIIKIQHKTKHYTIININDMKRIAPYIGLFAVVAAFLLICGCRDYKAVTIISALLVVLIRFVVVPIMYPDDDNELDKHIDENSPWLK